ncbi:MAG: hypothetical protein F4121_05630 [Acidimicrobiia bacterium]|nr:hypothetical protein [Acidimicrobiia bacterium]MYC44963.1 hypothetical protein [Acidimicrobiia bacterium]MYI19569.1 hypothetical protein [Acidimicrobiia bacterium]
MCSGDSATSATSNSPPQSHRKSTMRTPEQPTRWGATRPAIDRRHWVRCPRKDSKEDYFGSRYIRSSVDYTRRDFSNDPAEETNMSSTEERVRALVDANLDIDGRSEGQPLTLDLSIVDAGVSSTDVVAFWKVVCAEFGVDIPAEEFAELLTPGDLIAYLDAQ